ncbi:MAG TPA: sigma-70 family RNA polymerase sigma factor, partial [Nannocystis sp.]
DARAADALTRRHLAPLRQFLRTKVRPDDVEDLLQQVWLALGETQGRAGGADIRGTLRGYLFGIARHVLFAHIRAKHRSAAVDPIESSIAALDPSLSQAVGEQLAARRMMLALQRLPLDTQVLLELRYFQAMSTAELAAMYEVPVGTIKSRLSQARKLLDTATKLT